MNVASITERLIIRELERCARLKREAAQRLEKGDDNAVTFTALNQACRSAETWLVHRNPRSARSTLQKLRAAQADPEGFARKLGWVGPT